MQEIICPNTSTLYRKTLISTNVETIVIPIASIP